MRQQYFCTIVVILGTGGFDTLSEPEALARVGVVTPSLTLRARIMKLIFYFTLPSGSLPRYSTKCAKGAMSLWKSPFIQTKTSWYYEVQILR